MSELKESQWLSSYDETDYDGLLKSPGILHHSMGLQPHHQDLQDQKEFLYRILLWHTKLPRITKDSTDSDLQCTVTAGSWFDEDGTIRTVAEKNNVGLTDDATNYLYYPADSTSSSGLLVNTTGYPAITDNVPHIRIGAISVTGGYWDISDLTDARFSNLIMPVFGMQDHLQRRAQVAIGPITYDNAAAGLSDQAMNYGGYTRGFVAPRAGYLVSCSATLSAARAAGTLILKPSVNGTSLTQTGLNLTFDGTTTQTDWATVAYAAHANYAFSAGDRLSINATSDGSWSPTTDDITASLGVCYTGA